MRKIALLMLSSLTFACGGGDGSGNTSDALADYYRNCGIISEGKLGPPEGIDVDPCVVDCIVNTDCAELTALACSEGTPPTEALTQCFEACQAAEPQVECGDGTSIPQSYVCDGFDDCENASDEAGCPEIVCDNGASVFPQAYACDGDRDCDDGTDEMNCPGFTCGDGTVVPASFECDLAADCADGSDEAGGCATKTCPMP